MRKLKSKRGLTLVELLVTVAVLGIVSGFSITIIVTAMNNYTEAAMMQKDQSTALLLEDYIVRSARVSRTVEFIKNDGVAGSSVEVPSQSHQGFYIAKINNVIETFDYAGLNDDNNITYQSSDPHKYTGFTYENVQKLTFGFSRQKNYTDDIENQCIYVLDYTISMMSGYVLRGQVVMNNADAAHFTELVGGEEGGNTHQFIDPLAEYTLMEVTEGDDYVYEPEYNAAIVFR